VRGGISSGMRLSQEVTSWYVAAGSNSPLSPAQRGRGAGGEGAASGASVIPFAEPRSRGLGGSTKGHQQSESRFLSRAPGVSQGRFCAALLRNDRLHARWHFIRHASLPRSHLLVCRGGIEFSPFSRAAGAAGERGRGRGGTSGDSVIPFVEPRSRGLAARRRATSMRKVDFSVARRVCRRDGFAWRSFEMTGPNREGKSANPQRPAGGGCLMRG
jgi:hypothetical protein